MIKETLDAGTRAKRAAARKGRGQAGVGSKQKAALQSIKKKKKKAEKKKRRSSKARAGSDDDGADDDDDASDTDDEEATEDEDEDGEFRADDEDEEEEGEIGAFRDDDFDRVDFGEAVIPTRMTTRSQHELNARHEPHATAVQFSLMRILRRPSQSWRLR